MIVNVDQLNLVKRWQLIRRFRHLKLRRIKDANAKLLAKVQDDATVDTKVLPRSLSDALPEDPVARANDKRAIVVTEATGRFNMIGCNKAWENLCGHAECDIIGKDSSILQNPDTNTDGLRDAVSRLFDGESNVACVTTNKRKDGSRFKCLLTMGPIRNEAGKITHLVADLKNIGEVKQYGCM